MPTVPTSNPLARIGDTVTSVRSSIHLTQAALADDALIPLADLRAIEAGRHPLTVLELIRLSIALDIEPEALVRGATRTTSPSSSLPAAPQPDNSPTTTRSTRARRRPRQAPPRGV